MLKPLHVRHIFRSLSRRTARLNLATSPLSQTQRNSLNSTFYTPYSQNAAAQSSSALNRDFEEEPHALTPKEKESLEGRTAREKEDHTPTTPKLGEQAPVAPSPPLRHSHLSPLPLPQSPFHHSLPSFLAHAARIGLSPTSTVYIGTVYEYTCIVSLRRFGFHLIRTGGAGDEGVDFVGTWSLPTFAAPLRVVGQCKWRGSTRGKPGPVLIRELEGGFTGGPVRWREHDEEEDVVNGGKVEGEDKGRKRGGLEGLVGVLCTPGEPTKALREAVKRSSKPLVVAIVGREGRVGGVFWNKRVEHLGVEGWDVGSRYGPRNKVTGEREVEAVLLWEGSVWGGEVGTSEKGDIDG